LPVEENIDIIIGDDEKTFADLDKAAAIAIKTLEKRNKELKKSMKTARDAAREEKKGGIFAAPADPEKDLPRTGGAPFDISKKKSTFVKDLEAKLSKEINQKLKVGFREAFDEQAGGTGNAKFLFALGKNPLGTVRGLIQTIPFLGGIVAVADFAQAMLSEIEKIDRFFKKFIDIIDTRVNQLRNKVEQAHIRAGDTQLIITTTAGGTEPREVYNTFDEFNKNRMKLEADFAIRDKSGV